MTTGYQYTAADINPPTANSEKFGNSVAISADGLVLAVGEWEASWGPHYEAGRVLTYDRAEIESDWVLRAELYPTGPFSDNNGGIWDYLSFGRNLSLSQDGAKLAVCGMGYGWSFTNQGCVLTYTWSGSAWVNEDITYSTLPRNGRLFGLIMAMSANGLVLAVGDDDDEVGTEGVVEMFDWFGYWEDRLENFLPAAGTIYNWIGQKSLALNHAGSRLCIDGDDNISGDQVVLIVDWNGTAWVNETLVSTNVYNPPTIPWGNNNKIHNISCMNAAGTKWFLGTNDQELYFLEYVDPTWVFTSPYYDNIYDPDGDNPFYIEFLPPDQSSMSYNEILVHGNYNLAGSTHWDNVAIATVSWHIDVDAMANCYWVKEYGAIEYCGVDGPPVLPDLPVGWIPFSTTPDNTGGRGSYTYSGEQTVYPQQAKPAFGNGVLVIACAYAFGVQPEVTDGSHETYGVFVSEDDGFTYGPFIDKFPWLAGGAVSGGYDANMAHWEYNHHFGTKISFDGSLFYVVSTTGNDADELDLLVVTSRSSDGVSWLTNTVAGNNQAVTGSDSFDGDLWHIGNNSPLSEQSPFPDDTLTVSHSNDHGATWTLTTYAVQAQLYWNQEPDDRYYDCSANADGLHFIAEQLVPNGIAYYRPTSKTTWAAGILLFDRNDFTGFLESKGICVIGSRVNPGHVYASICTQGYNEHVAFRRSIDSGVTFEAKIFALTQDYDTRADYFDQNISRTYQRLVELDDGRIVVVAVHDVAGSIQVSYAVSSDAGISFAPYIAAQVGGWVADTKRQGERMQICAKGNDVVVVATSRIDGSNTLIFRP